MNKNAPQNGKNPRETLVPGFRLTPLRIAAIYAFFSALWFLFSTWIVFRTFDDPAMMQSLQNLNALVFIIFTAWLVFFLTNSYAKETRASQQALSESEHLYHSTIDTLHQGIVVVHPDLRVAMCNTVFAGWTGCSPGGDVVLPDLLPGWPASAWDEYRALFNGAGIVTGEASVQAGSRTIPVQCLKIPIVEKDEIRMALTVLRDISGEKRLENIKREMFMEIEQSTLGFARLSDQIRNPLQVILALTCLHESPEHATIAEQVREIDRIIQQLDQGWVTSDTIRAFLRRHYGEDSLLSHP
ncbi:MAG: hypothetical protein GKC04_07560 [Methanomicrobiales archaeon]|nr:hypothetical protein [Methanomicrobiales archaeon]